MLDFKGSLIFTGWRVDSGLDSRGRAKVRFFLPGNSRMLNGFLAIRDLRSFSLFVDDYGMAMIAPMLEARMKEIPGAPSGNWSDFIIISDVAPELAWERIQDDIEELQADLQHIMKERKEKKFFDQLKEGLSGLKTEPYHEKGNLWMAAYPQDIRQACYIQLALGNKRFGICQHCNRSFVQTKNKKYCGQACKDTARENRREFSEIELEKRRLRSRLDTRRKQEATTTVIESEIGKMIKDARSLEALEEIARKYPIMERQRNGGRT